MNYSTLSSRVADELNRDDLTSKIADWVNEARRQIADGELPIPNLGYHRFSWLYENSSLATVSGTALYDWPSDCIDEISLFYPTDNKPLIKKTPKEMDREYYRGNDYDDTGEPAHYVLRGTQYQIYPCPDGAYTYYLRYYAYPTDLSDSSDEETIDTQIPALIVSAASLLGAINLHDAEMIDMFMGVVQIRYENAQRKDVRRQRANLEGQRILTHRDFATAHFRALRGD